MNKVFNSFFVAMCDQLGGKDDDDMADEVAERIFSLAKGINWHHFSK